jgi:hypothetical protein
MPKRRALALLGAVTFIAAGCSAPPGSSEQLGTTRSAASTQFPNDQTAYDYFRAKGFTTFQAAAIVGNLDQESGVDPTISQFGGGPGRGIAQWSAGGRWDTSPGDNLMAFAMQQGQDPLSLGVQLDFIWFELTMFPSYGLAMLQASTNLTDATTDFELGFEGCADPSVCAIDSRISYAMAVLNAYANDPVPDAGPGTGTDSGATGDDAAAGDDATTPADTGPGGSSGGSSGSSSGGSSGGSSGSSSGGSSGSVAGSSSGSSSGGPAGSGSGGGSTADASSGGSSGGPGQGAAFTNEGGGCAIARDGSRGSGAAVQILGLALVLGVWRRRPRAGRVRHVSSMRLPNSRSNVP